MPVASPRRATGRAAADRRPLSAPLRPAGLGRDRSRGRQVTLDREPPRAGVAVAGVGPGNIHGRQRRCLWLNIGAVEVSLFTLLVYINTYC